MLVCLNSGLFPVPFAYINCPLISRYFIRMFLFRFRLSSYFRPPPFMLRVCISSVCHLMSDLIRIMYRCHNHEPRYCRRWCFLFCFRYLIRSTIVTFRDIPKQTRSTSSASNVVGGIISCSGSTRYTFSRRSITSFPGNLRFPGPAYTVFLKYVIRVET